MRGTFGEDWKTKTRERLHRHAEPGPPERVSYPSRSEIDRASRTTRESSSCVFPGIARPWRMKRTPTGRRNQPSSLAQFARLFVVVAAASAAGPKPSLPSFSRSFSRRHDYAQTRLQFTGDFRVTSLMSN